jgi:futalosine hydrolase
MSFKILYVTATEREADALNRVWSNTAARGESAKHEISLLVTGVGSVPTAWSLKQWINLNGKPDLAINGGIAGSYKDDIIPGDVVMPYSDCFADAGIEDNEKFMTLSEAGLINADEFPFTEGMLRSDSGYYERMKSLLKPVKAITVNTATGSEATRIKLVNKFNPDIETMEGATFFYICSMENVPFLALRAVSNKVEPRNKNNWKIDLAISSLSSKLKEVLLTL